FDVPNREIDGFFGWIKQLNEVMRKRSAAVTAAAIDFADDNVIAFWGGRSGRDGDGRQRSRCQRSQREGAQATRRRAGLRSWLRMRSHSSKILSESVSKDAIEKMQ